MWNIACERACVCLQLTTRKLTIIMSQVTSIPSAFRQHGSYHMLVLVTVVDVENIGLLLVVITSRLLSSSAMNIRACVLSCCNP